MTSATTDCVIAACPLAPSSYSTMSEPLHNSTMIFKDCLCWPLCPTLLQIQLWLVYSKLKEGWVIGGWGCCWCFSLISTVEIWRIVIFFGALLTCCQWSFGKKCKPGLKLAFARTWSSLSQAFSPTPLWKKLGWDWALSTHFEFLKRQLLFILPFKFFISKGDGLST